jgi:mono/diheme cytochrome c family protein
MRVRGLGAGASLFLVLFVAIFVALMATVGWVYWASERGPALLSTSATSATSAFAPSLIARGAYVAKLGNCEGCHSAPGQPAFAGGRSLETPFGTIYTSNLTPDVKTGLGAWGADDFWRAMHHGRSKNGRLLNPAFPFSSYSLMTREDSDALYAYLRSLAAVAQENRIHDLRFPYNTQFALRVWRALYFYPQGFQARADKTAEWNRGAYLVQGLGHCAECHSARTRLGGVQYDPDHLSALAGGVMPAQNWYAPSLRDASEAGLQAMSGDEAISLFKDGVTQQASMLGPMADVVYRSTQHWTPADLAAMTLYLKDLPGQPPGNNPKKVAGLNGKSLSDEAGAAIYKTHCADCHGENGQGSQVEGAPAYPRLAGNRAVTMSSPLNLIRIVVQGGFSPSTAGNPQPFGMPPYSHTLNDSEVAQVLSFIRQSWGNNAGAVYALDVVRSR